MLHADKDALRTRLKVKLLMIRQKELAFYTNNCTNIGINALLFGSFAWWGLTEPPFDELGDDRVQAAYLGITALNMALQLIATVNSTLCAILGPALAIRGPDGAMHVAVEGMLIHYRITLAIFSVGVFLFELSALAYVWMTFEAGEARREQPSQRRRARAAVPARGARSHSATTTSRAAQTWACRRASRLWWAPSCSGRAPGVSSGCSGCAAT